jgi:hypothetical protein
MKNLVNFFVHDGAGSPATQQPSDKKSPLKTDPHTGQIVWTVQVRKYFFRQQTVYAKVLEGGTKNDVTALLSDLHLEKQIVNETL